VPTPEKYCIDLAEAFPAEVQALYKQYAESYASGQNVVNLTLVSALGGLSPVRGQ